MSVSAKKDANGTWRIQFRYKDWKGESHKTQKRGFRTKKEAEDWLSQFLLQQAGDISMTFGEFWEIYKGDMGKRLRVSTMYQKEHVFTTKLQPYFGDTPLNKITPPMIRKWQGEMISLGYKETYLKNLNNHLTCILNYAVRYYNLKSNPCRKAGSMGKSRADKVEFWTLEEFTRFLNEVADKKISWIAFKILFWTGMRLGEMLALTVKDLDFENNTISITKSLNRMNGENLITPPKTAQSVRTIIITEELAKDLKEYVDSLYSPSSETRIFSSITKHYLEHEIKRGIRQSGVKKIHIHCLRHSHATMLVQMGFSPVEIAERLGHGRVTTTIETYCHSSSDCQKKMVERLSEMEKDGGVKQEGESDAL